jgi:peptidoglycan/xylan/chitin deacetylase (PgdA/CDA1 family)
MVSTLPILCYHNVAEPPESTRFKLLYVSPAKFERQLWTMRRLGLRGVSISEGLRRLDEGSSRRYVALTFDDGYADTVTAAAPLLKQYGFSATCYVVSGAVGTHNRWDEEFLQQRKPLMSREQIEQWLSAGMEVGSHTSSHPRLHEVTRDEALREIADSRAALRDLVGAGTVAHFAYPFGQFTDDVSQLVRSAGYLSAVTVLHGVARASDDRYRLPRILVDGEKGLWRLLVHLATPYDRLRRRRTP